jgi:ADP-ribose pyrophosphatase YjhB (NUDIX family)
MDASPTETVTAVVLLRNDGAALFQLRDDKPDLRHAGRWVIPGGHQEPGETLEASARRELREETAYDCGPLQWLSTLDDRHDPRYPAYRLVVFWGRYDGRQPVRCLEGQALRFIERAQAASYAIPAYLVGLWDGALAASAQAVDGGTQSPLPVSTV